MIKMTLEKLSDEWVEKLTNTFAQLVPDYDEIYARFNKILYPYSIDFERNNPEYANVVPQWRDYLIYYYISPRFLNLYAYYQVKGAFDQPNPPYETYGDSYKYRYRFLNENPNRKKRFEQYLRENNMTDDEYWFEYILKCTTQEYTLYANIIGEHLPFPNKNIDVLAWVGKYEQIKHIVQEIVINDNCYTPI